MCERLEGLYCLRFVFYLVAKLGSLKKSWQYSVGCDWIDIFVHSKFYSENHAANTTSNLYCAGTEKVQNFTQWTLHGQGEGVQDGGGRQGHDGPRSIYPFSDYSLLFPMLDRIHAVSPVVGCWITAVNVFLHRLLDVNHYCLHACVTLNISSTYPDQQ